jgi:hypothetical protein
MAATGHVTGSACGTAPSNEEKGEGGGVVCRSGNAVGRTGGNQVRARGAVRDRRRKKGGEEGRKERREEKKRKEKKRRKRENRKKRKEKGKIRRILGKNRRKGKRDFCGVFWVFRVPT